MAIEQLDSVPKIGDFFRSIHELRTAVQLYIIGDESSFYAKRSEKNNLHYSCRSKQVRKLYRLPIRRQSRQIFGWN